MDRREFEVRLEGEVRPETVPVGVLADFLKGLEQAVGATADVDLVTGPDEDGPLLSLVGVGPGSDRLLLSIPTHMTAVAAVVTTALATRELERLPARAVKGLRSSVRLAQANGWSIRIPRVEELGIPDVEIGPTEDIPVVEAFRLSGTTTLSGRCIQVGGVTPKARLRMANDALFSVDLDEATARFLATRLYDEVVLEGVAQWDADTLELVSFKATRVTSYERVNPELAVSELARAAGSRWNGVDAAEFVRAQRGE